MSKNHLESPVGHYQPELLILAPESGEDLNTLSFVAQLLELGVSIELDENWHLPTAPPKDLSAYKACCFPETAKARYDKDLNAFYRNGGFLGYFKYYPVQTDPQMASVHHFFQSYGRDVYFWTLANALVEGGLSLNNPDFARTMETRSVSSMIAEYRQAMFARYDRPIEVWRNWGDPGYTQFLSNFILAETLEDGEWLRLANYCLQTLNDSKAEALTRRITENQLEDTVDIHSPMMGGLLMQRGVKTHNQPWIDSGIELTRFFLDHCQIMNGAVVEKWMRVMWSESMLTAPTLFWLARVTGDKRRIVDAENTVRAVAAATHHANGLWHHWADQRGTKGAFWSRGAQWPLLWMTQALMAVDPAGEIAGFMRSEIAKTFDALQRFQDRDRGLWRLVIDEPETRLESSASGAIIYCYDRLREMGLMDPKYGEMIERAFTGLKRLYYRTGVAATCRGTAMGVPEYYRTRPMGYHGNSLFNAAMAPRSSPDRPSASEMLY
ncbi:MAG: glycoside hydrolase family 88 protein [Verrucomicrobia bacterium]|nr:glycoside hydrolase family 88 protein [Verrucomicrobiota bacterium]